MSAVPKPEIFYPSSDGKPMADNTRQLQWIIVLVTNLEALFNRTPDVFVGGNQNWYPVQGEPTHVQAPDAYVVFGRPKGHRDSYKQWEENDVPMAVVFEVLSPSNDHAEMTDKFLFYDEHGVEEYYVYDPLKNRFFAYVRGAATLVPQKKAPRFTSPRLGVTFDLTGPEMTVYNPDGRPFRTFTEIKEENQRLEAERQQINAALQQAEQRAIQAEQQLITTQETLAVSEEDAKQAELRAIQAQQQAAQAEQQAAQAQQQVAQAQQQAAQAQQQAAQAQQRSARMAFLVQRVMAGQATPEEALELQQLSQAAGS